MTQNKQEEDADEEEAEEDESRGSKALVRAKEDVIIMPKLQEARNQSLEICNAKNQHSKKETAKGRLCRVDLNYPRLAMRKGLVVKISTYLQALA